MSFWLVADSHTRAMIKSITLHSFGLTEIMVSFKSYNVFMYMWLLFVVLFEAVFCSVAYAVSWDDVTLNGYVSAEYEQSFGTDTLGDVNGSFDMDLVDLVFNFRPTDRLRIATDFTWEHGSASEDGRGNVAIEYAFAEYAIFGSTKVRVGKMFTHFGIYNEIHTAKPATLTVKEPLSTNKNNKLGSTIRFYPRWLNGVALVGATTGKRPFSYIIQVSNGDTLDEESNPYEEDNNSSKAINGRLLYQPLDGLQLGASYYMDTMRDSVLGHSVDIKSSGIQAEWELESGFGLEFEYVSGTEGYQARDIKRDAYTLMFYQRFNDRYTPYLRFETLDPDKKMEDDNASIIIWGVNILIDENMFVKLEVDDFSSGVNNVSLGGESYSEFKASLSIGF